jgi:hypothetical protein
MKSQKNKRFRKLYDKLPKEVQDQAKAAFALFKDDPFHNSLHFKEVDNEESIWAVRIGLHYRALGIREDNTIYWYWIGTHAEYDKLV